MTVHIERFGPDRIQITAGPRYGDLIRQVPGARYRNAQQDWTAALSWAACVQLRAVFGAELEVGPALAKWSWERHADITKVLAARVGGVAAAPPQIQQIIGAWRA